MPDLPGCFSAGDTFDEALAAAVDVNVARSHGATRSGFLADAARLAMR